MLWVPLPSPQKRKAKNKSFGRKDGITGNSPEKWESAGNSWS